MSTAAGSEDYSRIRVTRAVRNELQAMREADPRKAEAVDDAIKRIPHVVGDPIRINLPGAPDREYRAIFPRDREAPVVIYRSLQREGGVDEGWAVTTLIDQSEYRKYKQAERSGIIDSPMVTGIAGSVAGSVSSLIGGGDVSSSGETIRGPRPQGKQDDD